MEVEKTGLSSLAGSTTKPTSQDVGKPKTGCSSANATGPDDTARYVKISRVTGVSFLDFVQHV